MNQYKGIKIQEIVNDVEWQKLRSGLVGQWKEHEKESLKKLKDYVGPVTKADEYALVRVYNYLTGTAFRLGKIMSFEITQFKDKVKKELDKRK